MRTAIPLLLYLALACAPAAADEGLFVIGAVGDAGPGSKERPRLVGLDASQRMVGYPRAATYLYFPRTQELQRNNLLPPTEVGAKVEGWYATGSPRGRLFLATVQPTPEGRQLELRLPSPFRNLPFVETPPFRRYPLVGGPLLSVGQQLWGGDGIQWPAWSVDGAHLAYVRGGVTIVHHQGGGELFQVSDPQKRRVRFGHLPGTLGHLGAYPDTRLYTFPLPQQRGAHSTAAFRTQPVHVEATEVPMLHISPDGRMLARMVHDNGNARLLVGPVERPALVWSQDMTRRVTHEEGGRLEVQTDETARVSPVGWTQSGSDYLFAIEVERRVLVRERRSAGGRVFYNENDRLSRWSVVGSRLMAWRPRDGARVLMDLPCALHHDLLHYHAPVLVDETARYVALWGSSTADLRRDLPRRDYTQRRGAAPVELLVADLEAKTVRRVLASGHAFDAATWIKTQEGDDTDPTPAHEEPQPQLPQYFLRFYETPRLVTTNFVWALEVPLEGKALDLQDPQRKFSLAVRFELGVGLKLRDIDQQHRDAEGNVYFEQALDPKQGTTEGTHFKRWHKAPFCFMDMVGAGPVKLRILATPLRDGRPMVEARSPLIEIPDEKVPKVYFTQVRVEQATDAQGVPGIRFRSHALLRELKGQEVRIEASGGPADGVGIRTPDVPSEHRLTQGLGGVAQRLTPATDAESLDVDLFVPLARLNAAHGESQVRVLLRAFRGQRTYIGGTHDFVFTIRR